MVAMSYALTPQIVKILQFNYGSSGAILIHAGLVLNTCVTCALFQDVKKHEKIIQVPASSETMNGKPGFMVKNHLTRVQSNFQIVLGSSTYSLSSIQPTNTKQKEQTDENGLSKKESVVSIITGGMKQNLKALRSFRVLINGIAFAVFVVGFSNFIILIPPMMTEIGHSYQDAAFAISCGSFGNFLGRLSMAFLSDQQWFSNKMAYKFGGLLAATTTLCKY